MQSALKLKATILPGKRVEFIAPELTEGECVEVIIPKDAPAAAAPEPPRQFETAWEFIQSLPPSTLTGEDWERMEREFYEERNSWGD